MYPDSKVHGANIGPAWGQQDAGGPMYLVIWVATGIIFAAQSFEII